ncbi:MULTISPECIES: methylated-DNA--[protein]-cysteine S-methyltransferase [unclassified Nocardia]|uniref:methylated-DNA--[protein]-cysteine S-methyltransferase n=1 Tax=unclassified Nocardia TaxID=2637762 RepID=UPI003449BA94
MSDTATARLVHGSTLGNLLIEANQTGVTMVAFTDAPPTGSSGKNVTAREHLEIAADQIDEYCTGERQQFTVPMDLTDMSAFDREVLRTLEATTGYGRTTTYGALTRQLGRTVADARKVGGALSHNRLLILLPCHRVIGADGSLTGYAGGLPAKRALLDLESADLLLPLGG